MGLGGVGGAVVMVMGYSSRESCFLGFGGRGKVMWWDGMWLGRAAGCFLELRRIVLRAVEERSYIPTRHLC